jgi:MarR family protein
VTSWSFLTNHAQVLMCIARDPGVRLRDIAASLGITERSAYGIVTDLAAAGYVVKQKDGRRNRYQIQAQLPLPGPGTWEPAIGEVLAVLLGDTSGIAGLTGLYAATTTRAGRLRHEHSRNSDPAPGVQHSGHVLASRTPARFSDNEIPIEKISDLVGHSDTTTTETIYRFQIRPVVLDGAEAMDRIFPAPEEPQER